MRGRWQDAKLHALRSANYRGPDGLLLGSLVCDALCEWERSERLISEVCRDYFDRFGMHWYLWCRRTGRGDLESARERAQLYLPEARGSDRQRDAERAVFYYLEGQPAQTIAILQRSFQSQPTFEGAFLLAQLHRDDPDQRTAWLQKMQQVAESRANTRNEQEAAHDAAGMAILNLLRHGDTSAEKIRQIEELLGRLDAPTAATNCYFVGKELDELGQTEGAETFYRRALCAFGGDHLYAALAGYELAQRHGTSRADDDILDESDVWPPSK